MTHYATEDSLLTTQRMSAVLSGLCSPTHVNMEVWPAGIEALLAVYNNESYLAGGVGYLGRQVLTHCIVVVAI